MKKITIGITAHVDSGKTTLSEALLYTAGEILKLGRVDYKNSFLDTNTIERERGITIFSKQARFNFGHTEFTLLDTPGHVDLSAETERTFCILDYAVLVISGIDKVQSHTETLWKLLKHYNIPVFIFVNKTDIAESDNSDILADIHAHLSDACIDFSVFDSNFYENAAMYGEDMLNNFLASGKISDQSLARAVTSRKLFPVFFGSALKLDKISEFLSAIDTFTITKKYPENFGAKIYKIADGDKGQRLTFMKITGGELPVKSVIDINGNIQKINEIRLYSGDKFESVQKAYSGDICAVSGLSGTFAGQGLGVTPSDDEFLTEPIFTYSVRLPDGYDTSKALAIFKKLEQEDSKLYVNFSEHLQKIDIQVMGEIQLEILKRLLYDRFGLDAKFEHGSIIYKETVSGTFEGVGHYEPLKHYAEVHLLLEPLKPSSGIVITSACDENTLDKNWQNLILTHLHEKVHLGVLAGFPITDIKITLLNGLAHKKHTEGGDFRQATYRALRQGLMLAKAENKCVLLEPWYDFTLELPICDVGRAMTDLDMMGAEFEQSSVGTDISVIMGKGPISELREYGKSVISYTHGKGRFNCSFSGYAPARKQTETVERLNYDPEADLMNSPDSVFCSHGTGFLVKWNEVYDHMHLPLKDTPKEYGATPTVRRDFKKSVDDEAEILRMFEMVYGKIKRREPEALHTPKNHHPDSPKSKSKPIKQGPTYLLVDGYNIIHAWDELREMADESLDLARSMLINRLCNYQAMRGCNVILVFDAYKVKGGVREIEKSHGITVVYTKEAETADQYIERTSTELAKDYRVRVATSDSQIQMIIFGSGAARVTPLELLTEINEAEKQMRDIINNN